MLALVLIILATWLSVDYILAKGWVYVIAKQLPVFKSLHINYRFMSLFFLPLALTGSLILNDWFTKPYRNKANVWFVMLNLFTLISPLSYFLYTQDVHFRGFDVTKLLAAYQRSQQGETFPVEFVADSSVRDWNAFLLDATTISPYEAVFGYDLQGFKPQIHPGPIFEITDRYFNMTNPASLTFPGENGGTVFSRFEETDRVRLEEFLQRRQPDWNIPKIQIACNYVSAPAFLISMATILFRFFRPTKLIALFRVHEQ